MWINTSSTGHLALLNACKMIRRSPKFVVPSQWLVQMHECDPLPAEGKLFSSSLLFVERQIASQTLDVSETQGIARISLSRASYWPQRLQFAQCISKVDFAEENPDQYGAFRCRYRLTGDSKYWQRCRKVMNDFVSGHGECMKSGKLKWGLDAGK